MKGVLVILDGLGDLPCDVLKGKTPLEAAKTPNMDFFATRGELGYLYPVKPGFAPASDEAVLSIFDNDISLSSRGQLEARGADIELSKGDLALRVNFATIDNLEKGNIIDRRAGRMLFDKEAKALEKAINSINFPIKFEFKHTVGYRGVLVFRGTFSSAISGNDMTYVDGKATEVMKIQKSKPLNTKDEVSPYTCNVLNEFFDLVYETLKEHPVNIERKRRGLMPANYMLFRGAGVDKPKLKLYRNWMALGYMPLEKGIAKVSGMGVYGFNYPGIKDIDVYKNLYDGLRLACKHAIKYIKKYHKKYDYFYIHLKETDLPGHDNKPFEKRDMIEYIDANLFKFLKRFLPPNNINLVVTADHSTVSKIKAHSAEPVPVLFYDSNRSIPQVKKKPVLKQGEVEGPRVIGRKFCEREARVGNLGRMVAGEMLKKAKFIR